MVRRRGALETHPVGRRRRPAWKQRDEHDTGHDDDPEHLGARAENSVGDSGAVQYGEAGTIAYAAAHYIPWQSGLPEKKSEVRTKKVDVSPLIVVERRRS